jgi:hypothetical protein
MPVRLDSLTRKVKLLLALGVLGITSELLNPFRVNIAGADESKTLTLIQRREQAGRNDEVGDDAR